MARRVVVAPDKLRGSASARAAAAAIAAGVRRAGPELEVVERPIADGGEGTVEALVVASGGRLVRHEVMGPLPAMRVEAALGLIDGGRTAVIEMAAASGLSLLAAEQRDPTTTTSFGAGELLRYAAELGCERVIVGLGGSATCDAGLGFAQGAGLVVRLEQGELATSPLCGRDLPRISAVELPRTSPLSRMEILGACDVDNPLLGPRGASRVFALQKGATPTQVRTLEQELAALVRRLGGEAAANERGAGAAGGLGFALRSFFGAELRSGAELVLERVQLRERVEGAALCFTAEGKLDAQSFSGKATLAVARLCRGLGVPCVALTGTLDASRAQLRAEGFSDVVELVAGEGGEREAMRDVLPRLERAAEQVTRAVLGAG